MTDRLTPEELQAERKKLQVEIAKRHAETEWVGEFAKAMLIAAGGCYLVAALFFVGWLIWGIQK